MDYTYIYIYELYDYIYTYIIDILWKIRYILIINIIDIINITCIYIYI